MANIPEKLKLKRRGSTGDIKEIKRKREVLEGNMNAKEEGEEGAFRKVGK